MMVPWVRNDHDAELRAWGEKLAGRSCQSAPRGSRRDVHAELTAHWCDSDQEVARAVRPWVRLALLQRFGRCMKAIYRDIEVPF